VGWTWVLAVLGVGLIGVVMWDAFETIVLPRRVTRRLRLTRLFYVLTWQPWSAVGRRLPPSPRREGYLSFFGPLSLLLLLVVWAGSLVLGFALLQAGLGLEMVAPEGIAGFGAIFYASGSNFFTLGIGDVTPRTALGRLLTVAEAGTGLAFLALVIGYIPVLFQSFSRREIYVSLLDARAGSPPCVGSLLRRYALSDEPDTVNRFMREWELWAAEILESHLSYPLLMYYRSQHERQSWLAALTVILDTTALVIVGIEGVAKRPAQLTFAMARHTAADLSQLFRTAPQPQAADRLPPADLERLRTEVGAVGLVLRGGPEADARLARLRAQYEPYVDALSRYLMMPLPEWLPPESELDDWQVTAWQLSE
jgi:Ion channel